MTLTVLVTGANRGLGLELTRFYGETGEHVLACVRDLKRATDLYNLAKVFPNISIHQLDVAQPETFKAFTEGLNHCPIDIVIHNAGIASEKGSVQTLSVSNLNHVWATNAVGPLLLSAALIPNLQISSKKLIVAISSLMGSLGNNVGGDNYGYRTSKAALNMFMKNLSIELQPQGIRVLMLHPGWVRTEMGGSQAPMTIKDSIAHMIQVIRTAKGTGLFLNTDGQPIPW